MIFVWKIMKRGKNCNRTVGDPGFPTGGASPIVRGANLLFGKIYAENCVKMKEIGSTEARVPSAPWIRHC